MNVESTSIDTVWWRQIPGGGQIDYWPPEPADSRRQRGAVVEALYFADCEDTAWAEWYRFIAEAGIPPIAALPRDLWRWQVQLDVIADLSDAERLARVGLPAPQPGRWEWPNFQAVGEALFADGWAGLIAPSAARPVGQVLCLFREDLLIPGTKALPPPVYHEFPPMVPTGLRT